MTATIFKKSKTFGRQEGRSDNARLIDEFHLFINPTAIGNGMTIFNGLNKNQKLILKIAKQFDCGIALTCYELDEQNQQ